MNGQAERGITMQYYILVEKEQSDTYDIDQPQNHMLSERSQTQEIIQGEIPSL